MVAYMKTFSLEIITPEKVAYKEEVEQISIPAFEGEMGVLPGHIDYLTMLNPGEIRIKKDDELKLFAVSGGFAEIHPKNVVVLCETAESAEEIDIEKAELSKQRAKEKLKNVGADLSAQSSQIESQIQLAVARLKVVSDLKKQKKKRIT
ncbi:MAG: ATP synthase F1 subunit epsilon [Elusimicrobiota bacterium]|nr:ATP synthase F1 subunit epsilon [Elusimicrobiota bacterium]